VTLKTAGGTLDWLCSTRLSLGMWPLIQIRLIWWLQTTGPEQIIDNKFRAIGASNWAALLVCCQNPQWLEPAPCCCCWAGESSCLQSSKAQLARHAPAACHDPPPPLAWYSMRRFADYSARQDKTNIMLFWCDVMLSQSKAISANLAQNMTKLLISNSKFITVMWI